MRRKGAILLSCRTHPRTDVVNAKGSLWTTEAAVFSKCIYVQRQKLGCQQAQREAKTNTFHANLDVLHVGCRCVGQAYTVEEVKERQAELSKMRALMLYQERKQHHMKKIKSKVRMDDDFPVERHVGALQHASAPPPVSLSEYKYFSISTSTSVHISRVCPCRLLRSLTSSFPAACRRPFSLLCWRSSLSRAGKSSVGVFPCARCCHRCTCFGVILHT